MPAQLHKEVRVIGEAFSLTQRLKSCSRLVGSIVERHSGSRSEREQGQSKAPGIRNRERNQVMLYSPLFVTERNLDENFGIDNCDDDTRFVPWLHYQTSHPGTGGPAARRCHSGSVCCCATALRQ